MFENTKVIRSCNYGQSAIKNKLHKLKLALTLSGILGGNALSANAVENNKTTDTSRTQYKTEVITKHINNQYTQNTLKVANKRRHLPSMA